MAVAVYVQQPGGRSPRVSEHAGSNPSNVSTPQSPQLHGTGCPNLHSLHGRQSPSSHPHSSSFRKSRSSGDGSWFGLTLTAKTPAGASALVVLGLLMGTLISFICTSTWMLSANPLGQGLPGLPAGISARTLSTPGRRPRALVAELPEPGMAIQRHSTAGTALQDQVADTGKGMHMPEAEGALQQRQKPVAGDQTTETAPHLAQRRDAGPPNDSRNSEAQHSTSSPHVQVSNGEEKAQHQPEPDQQDGFPALDMSLAEARTLAAQFFSKVFPADSPAAPELQRHPQALHLMSLLRRLWQAHSSDAESALSKDHCSAPSGMKLLQQALEAAEQLRKESCAASAVSLAFQQQAATGTPSDPGLPFVVLRRITLLVLHLAYQQGASSKQTEKACITSLSAVAPKLLLSFSASFNCSRSSRVAMELFHISKSGGTSMCQLAGTAGLANPGMNINANCLLPQFGGDPKWTQTEDFMEPRHHFWAAVDCRTWVQEEQMTCAERSSRLYSQGVNFYANEHTLHEGNASLGSAVPCPQVETVTVLRQPLERVRSHVIEVDRVYSSYRKFSMSYVRGRDLQDWQRWAPAVLGNYMTRSLLGRQAMCRSFGSLGEPELHAALLTLTSVDHVLILEDDRLNAVVMRAGMGWNQSLSSKHWRWSTKHDLVADLNFPDNTMQQLAAWNQLDQELYQWGRVLLRLDAAFHTTVAALAGRMECGNVPAAAAASTAAAEADAAISAAGAAAAAVSEAHSIDKALAHIGMKRVKGNLVSDVRAATTANRRKQLQAARGSWQQVAKSAFQAGSDRMSVRLMYGFANVDITEQVEVGSSLALAPALLPAGLGQVVMGWGVCAKSGTTGLDSSLCSCFPAGGLPAGAAGVAQQQQPIRSSDNGLLIRLPLYSPTRSVRAQLAGMYNTHA